jgi:hypothetical protein
LKKSVKILLIVTMVSVGIGLVWFPMLNWIFPEKDISNGYSEHSSYSLFATSKGRLKKLTLNGKDVLPECDVREQGLAHEYTLLLPNAPKTETKRHSVEILTAQDQWLSFWVSTWRGQSEFGIDVSGGGTGVMRSGSDFPPPPPVRRVGR